MDSPQTREEKYLAYLAGETSITLPEPITRKEKYLYAAALSGGGGSGTGGGTTLDHSKLYNRDMTQQHPINAITGLREELDKIPPKIESITIEELEGMLK